MDQIRWHDIQTAPSKTAHHMLADHPVAIRQTQRVVALINELNIPDPDEHQKAILAAWFHQIGKAEELEHTGCYHIDGALWLEAIGAPADIYTTILHHGNLAELTPKKIRQEHMRHGPSNRTLLNQLNRCWMRVSPHGHILQPQSRLEEIQKRCGAESKQAIAFANLIHGPQILC